MEDLTKIVTNFNPDLLMWARVNEGMTRQEASARITIASSATDHPRIVNVNEIFEMENGIKKPTYGMLEIFAKVFNRPVVLFLKSSIRTLKQNQNFVKH